MFINLIEDEEGQINSVIKNIFKDLEDAGFTIKDPNTGEN